MAENIIINFEANTSELSATIDLLEKLGQVDSKTAAQFRKANEEYEKRAKAFDTLGNEVEDFGRKSDTAGKKTVANLQKTTNSINDLKKTLLDVGKALGIAFGVQEVVNFGKESVKAFFDAELNARRLQNAVGVAGGLQSDFKELIEQSEQLQKITIFSDDDIQKVQAAGIQFGLTVDQVKELTPLVADFASATGQDIPSAMDAVVLGIAGSNRALRLYGIQVDSAADRATNLASITKQLNDLYLGQGRIIGETAAGKMARLKNAFEDLQESIGGTIVDIGDFGSALANKIGGLPTAVLASLATLAGPGIAKPILELQKKLQEAGKGQENFTNLFKGNLKKIFEGLPIAEIEARIKNTTDHIRSAEAEGNKKLADQNRATLQVLTGIRTEQITKLEQNISSISLDLVKKLAEDGSEIAKQELDRRKETNQKTLDEAARFAEKQKAFQKQVNDDLAQSNIAAIDDAFEARRAKEEQDFEEFKALLKQGVADRLTTQAEADRELQEREKSHQAILAQIDKDSDEARFKAQQDRNKQAAEVGFANVLAQIEKQQQEEIDQENLAFAKQKDHSESEELKHQQRLTAIALKYAQLRQLANEDDPAKRAEIQKEIDKIIAEGALNEVETAKATEKEKQEAILQTVDLIKEISGSLVDILGAGTQANIENINAEKEARLAALDEQMAALEEAHKNERLSDAALAKEKDKIRKEQEAAEKAAQKRINEEKRKQDLANRAQKIFEIGVATARNIVELAPAQAFLIPFYAALGAAQIAAVLATPLPKYHTGKRAGRMTAMEEVAIVHRDEDIFSPQTSKQFAPTFRAIHDGKVKALDLNRFVSWQTKQPGFAGNVAASLSLDYDLLAEKLGSEIAWQMRGKDSVRIKNVREFAEALGSGFDPRKI